MWRLWSPSESRRLVRGLTRLLRTITAGAWKPDHRFEDVHSQIQYQLERLIGPVARKLQTGRSRNDQVALDVRLYCREAITMLSTDLRGVQRALVRMAAAHRRVIIPGYTHLQQAQPILMAHHLLAYVEMFERDLERLHDARKRVNVLPLGAAALAGTSLPIDRRYVARLLRMTRIANNSMDAVSDRDFALELIFILAAVGVHLSRMAEDFILWSTEEFGLLALDDAFATGSSLMPQKKNPDVLELIRGQTGLLVGQLVAFLTMLKGQPLAYNRDLQWDKRLIFGAVDASHEALAGLERFIRHLGVKVSHPPRIMKDTLCATDLAEHLVTKGVVFARAHEIVGRLVSLAERRGVPLRGLDVAQVRQIAPEVDAAALRLLDPRRSVQRKRSLGSTNPRQVERAIASWRRRLGTG